MPFGAQAFRTQPTELDLNGPNLSFPTQPETDARTSLTSISLIGIATATFTDNTNPDNSGSLKYQWYEVGVGKLTDGTNIAGSATTTLTISDLVSPTDTGRQFFLEVDYVASTDTGNAVNEPLNSNTSTITVLPTLNITKQPTDETTVPDRPNIFVVEADLSDNAFDQVINYQWKIDGEDAVDGTKQVIIPATRFEEVYSTDTTVGIPEDASDVVITIASGSGGKGGSDAGGSGGSGGAGRVATFNYSGVGRTLKIRIGSTGNNGGSGNQKAYGNGGNSNAASGGRGGGAGQNGYSGGGAGGGGATGIFDQELGRYTIVAGGGGGGGGASWNRSASPGGAAGSFSSSNGAFTVTNGSNGATKNGDGGGGGAGGGGATGGSGGGSGQDNSSGGRGGSGGQSKFDTTVATLVNDNSSTTSGYVKIAYTVPRVDDANEYTNQITRTAIGGLNQKPSCTNTQNGWYTRTGQPQTEGNKSVRKMQILWGGDLIYEGSYSPNADGYMIIGNYAYIWGTYRSPSVYGWANNDSCGRKNSPNGDHCNGFDVIRYDYRDVTGGTDVTEVIVEEVVSGSTTPQLTVTKYTTGISTVSVSLSNSDATNSPVESNEVRGVVINEDESFPLIIEQIGNTGTASTSDINLFNGDYEFEVTQTGDLELGEVTNYYSFFSPDKDIIVEMDLFGGKGADNGSVSGGEGGFSRIRFTMEQNVEYVISGLNSIINTPFVYRKASLIACVGAGGDAGTTGPGGAGGGVKMSGQTAGGRGFGVGGESVDDGKLTENGVFGSEFSGASPVTGDSVATGVDGGRCLTCARGVYWRDQGLSPCEDIGTSQFVLQDGTVVTNTGKIERGYKAGYSIIETSGLSNSNGGNGGCGATGGAGGEQGKGGGGGSGYTDGSVQIISSTLGGNSEPAKVLLRAIGAANVGDDPQLENKEVTFTVTKESGANPTVTFALESGFGPKTLTFGPNAGKVIATIQDQSVYTFQSMQANQLKLNGNTLLVEDFTDNDFNDLTITPDFGDFESTTRYFLNLGNAGTNEGFISGLKGVGKQPKNLFDLNVRSSTAGNTNSSMTWNGEIRMPQRGGYYLILNRWSVQSQGPSYASLTVNGVTYTSNWSTLNTNARNRTVSSPKVIGNGGVGVVQNSYQDYTRSNPTPVSNKALTRIQTGPTGGGFAPVWFAVVFVPENISIDDTAKHIVIHTNN